MREVLIIHSSQTLTVYTLICGTSNTRHIESTFTELRSMIRQLPGCNVKETGTSVEARCLIFDFHGHFEAM